MERVAVQPFAPDRACLVRLCVMGQPDGSLCDDCGADRCDCASIQAIRNAMDDYAKSSRLYNQWRGMRDRCTRPDDSRWARYGGRGIRVCERWLSFENFLADMGEPPGPGRWTIDRKDNDGHYEPGNCRWASYRTQARNKSNNRVITWRGYTLCLAEWAERLAVPRSLLEGRLRRGWDVERAFTCPGIKGKWSMAPRVTPRSL